jgi:hypothetical protein
LGEAGLVPGADAFALPDGLCSRDGGAVTFWEEKVENAS